MSKNLSRKYHQENKERPQKKRAKNIKIFLKNKKKKKPQYGHERYKNLSKDEWQKLVEYRKNIKWKEWYIIITRKYFNLENFRKKS